MELPDKPPAPLTADLHEWNTHWPEKSRFLFLETMLALALGTMCSGLYLYRHDLNHWMSGLDWPLERHASPKVLSLTPPTVSGTEPGEKHTQNKPSAFSFPYMLSYPHNGDLHHTTVEPMPLETSGSSTHASRSMPPADPRGKYRLQVLSFYQEEDAILFTRKLLSAGFSAHTHAANNARNERVHRVQVGPFASMHHAKKAKQILESTQGIIGVIFSPEQLESDSKILEQRRRHRRPKAEAPLDAL